MRILLTREQIKLVSDFCTDVAKGLTLAGILGQALTEVESAIVRTLGSAAILILGFIFLYIGVRLRKI